MHDAFLRIYMLTVHISVAEKDVMCGRQGVKAKEIPYEHVERKSSAVHHGLIKTLPANQETDKKDVTPVELYPGDKLLLIEEYDNLRTAVSRRKRNKTIMGYGG